MDQQSVYIILPVYNEQAVLRKTVEQLLQYYPNIILVDDGSPIPQSDVLQHLQVTILRHRQNLGQGAAIQTGVEYALQKGASVVVHFDADGQHQVKDIAALLEPILHGHVDLVFGSRFLHPKTKPPFLRKLLLHCARIVNFLFSGLLLTDAHNGLRAMNRKAAQQLPIRENRMAHASEILFSVKRLGIRYTEVPVEVIYSEYSVHKGQRGLNSIQVFFDLLLHKLLK